MKKFKNSIKEEAKTKVKEELIKIIVNKISEEEEFKVLVSEIKNDFLEDVFDEKILNKNIDFIKNMDAVKNGNLSVLFDATINGKIKLPIETFKNDEDKINGKSLSDLSDLGFTCGIKKKVDKIKIYSHALEGKELSEIIEIINNEDGYNLIEYTLDTIHELMRLIDENKESLKVSFDRGNFQENLQLKGDVAYTDIYTVSNGEEMYNCENGVINKNHFSFKLETGPLSKIEVKDLFINGILIKRGFIEIQNAQKILDIVKNCYESSKQSESVKSTKEDLSKKSADITPKKTSNKSKNKK